MFHITNGKGFSIAFANGYTVSVQFGQGNYCQNRNCGVGMAYYEGERKLGDRGCSDAESAVFDPNGDSVEGRVLGWQTPEEVAATIAWAAAQPRIGEKA